MQTHKIAGQIMGDLESFHGSKPAIDADNILIVRGMSRKQFDKSMDEVLLDVLNSLKAQKIDTFSKEGGDIIGIIDERIRANITIQSETDVSGIHRMKDSLEAMNCDVEYILGLLDNIGIFIVTWVEKGGIGPRFVEVVVSNLE
ncbi:MAG: DUF2120 family protein [Methanobacterium sp.]|uniref:DUF2120 family protein n=1 Tax=Methanobacterium sp. TaxID=2164 RepID=UPI003D647D74|nr:DUF2120 family protein [Methanobacterium sp.]